MKTFFELSEELKSKATKLPWFINEDIIKAYLPKEMGTWWIVNPNQTACAPQNNHENIEYIVHCVNTHATLCGLLERALEELIDPYIGDNLPIKNEIQSKLTAMAREGEK